MLEELDIFGSMQAAIAFLFLEDALIREGNIGDYVG